MASNLKSKSSLTPIANPTSCYQTPSLSAQVVANNDDLLTQILVRLPINSLLTVKSVSKHWLSLISDPQFCRHLCRSSPLCNPSCGLLLLNPRLSNPDPVYELVNVNQTSSNLSGPVQSRIPNNPLLRLSFATDPMGGIKILQSCNGLFLCSTSPRPQKLKKYYAYHTTIKEESKKMYYVYNPTTKHYTILPELPVRSGAPRTVLGLTLAFDPSKSPHYKVVCVRCRERIHIHRQLDIEIYSSEMRSWRLSSSSPFFTSVPTYNLQLNGGVYWNGAVHWINSWGSTGALCFHMDEERLSEMPLPPLPEDWQDWNEKDLGYFGVSGDHLHLVGIYDSPSTHINVYEMERDYSGWSVRFRVDLAQVLAAFSDAGRFTLPVQDLSTVLVHYNVCGSLSR
ncbi:F-box protein At5g07610 [Ziziphus jujuba]|uniref:F-box protein At5g07610 n=1 Tax=Ziziphus jujuba TaxID=326968 RepID=A0A6P3Z6M7_ZIZJJ|nr:F-box protein At5g07610 [Ziziphus jujuba]